MVDKDAEGTVAERLQKLGVKGVLVQMAKNRQVLDLRCEMPTCYCPEGRRDSSLGPPPGTLPSAFGHRMPITTQPKKDGGHLRPWNVRLAHAVHPQTSTRTHPRLSRWSPSLRRPREAPISYQARTG